jgi:hypothetical protein
VETQRTAEGRRPVPALFPFSYSSAYHRHGPEQTPLYAIISEHYPRFMQEIERSRGHLPQFVR